MDKFRTTTKINPFLVTSLVIYIDSTALPVGYTGSAGG